MADIGDQGLFDPSGFVAGDPGTWPRPLDSGPYYAGQFWVASAAGTIDVPVVPGDRVYVVSMGRDYGVGTYGDAWFGWQENGPWADIEVSFRAWSETLPPWDRPATPYSGCPFDADRFPGWRVVVEVLQLSDTAVRTYGDLTYGEDLFGDVATVPRELSWFDITPTNFGIVIRRGNQDGNPIVAVDQCALDFVDLDADLWRMSSPDSWNAPRVGTRIRVGMLSPSLSYTAFFVGRIEQITDEHDAPPRLVQVDAYGSAFDLAVDVLRWSRPAEPANTRAAAIVARSGYDWAVSASLPPATGLLADPDPRDVVMRSELDRTALSVGQMFDTERNGAIRFRAWPDPGTGPVLEVSDCLPGLVAEVVTLVGDMEEVANLVTLSNVADEVVTRTDKGSINYYGQRTEGLGLPFADLATQTAALGGLADAILAVYGRTVNRVEAIEVDLVRSDAWFEELVALDLGRQVRFTRRAFPDHPLVVDAVVAGYEHRLTPGAWASTIHTTTRTPSI